jgi:release factor glutamine methyltransferase
VIIRDALSLSHKLTKISDSPRLDCELLLCHALQQERAYLYTWPEKQLSTEQEQRFLALLARREQGEPVAHLLGKKEFWSLPLQVNNTTLIPRPETELLIEMALELFSSNDSSSKKVADLGTGTGAIALALASEKPHWQIWGFEKYPQALQLAKINQQRLGYEQVRFCQSDWFSRIAEKDFDLIIANPPYIDASDPHLNKGDVRFEPKTALVAEQEGLADIATIIGYAPSYLRKGGWVLLEHGYQQAEAVQDLLQRQGFGGVRTRCDLAANPRVTIGQLADQ